MQFGVQIISVITIVDRFDEDVAARICSQIQSCKSKEKEKLSGIEIPFCTPVRTLDGVQAFVPDQREPCCRPTPTAFHA